MFGSILSASSFGYLDIGIIVFFALFLIVGLFRGFAKSLNGFFITIGIILLSLFLLGVTFDPIRESELSGKLETALENASGGWGDAFNDQVIITDNGLYAIHNGEQVPLSSVDGIKGKIANWLGKKFITEDRQTVASVVTDNLTSLIVSIIMFIVFCILMGLLLFVIRKLTIKMHYSEYTTVKTLDRVLGGVVSVGMSFVFVLFVFAIFSALQAKIPAVIDYIHSNTVSGWIYDINPVGKVFENIFVAKF